MKPTIFAVFCALSLHVAAAAADAVAPALGHPKSLGYEAPAGTNGSKAAAIPEAGAVVLGLVGAMMLLRRRR
jgi:hypothetical protein